MPKLNHFLNMEVLQAMKELRARNPIIADSFQELAQRYSEDRVFGLIRAVTLEQTKKVQSALQEVIRLGIPRELWEDYVLKVIKDGSRSYAENVFRTNINTVTHQGRARQARKFQALIVGFEFMATGGERKVGVGTGWGDGSTRKNHSKADGLRAPQDSPLWQLFWPPLGYQCRCTIREITRTEADKNGWLDDQGLLIPDHPGIQSPVTVGAMVAHGAGPDSPTFGRKQT